MMRKISILQNDTVLVDNEHSSLEEVALLLVENKQRVVKWMEDFEYLQVLRRVEEVRFMREIPLFGETLIGKTFGDHLISKGVDLGSCLMRRDEFGNFEFIWRQEYTGDAFLTFVEESYKYPSSI